MNVVGVDLSLTSTGICAVSEGRITDLHNIKTKGARSDTLSDRRKRLFLIANSITEWVSGEDTDLVVIEAPSYGSRFGSAHDRSGLWWILVGALDADYPLAQVSPQGRAKYGTGAGNSKKDVVEAFVREAYQPLCEQRIANDDVCDAILLASMGSRRLGFPVESTPLGEANLAAMDGVLWPSV